MSKESPWPTIHAERAALAADLEALTDEQWSTPSQCDGWTVRQTLAHMTAAATQTTPSFFTKMARAGFRFDKFAATDVARHLGPTPAATLAMFKAHVGDTSSPPGPVDTWLGETIVHA